MNNLKKFYEAAEENKEIKDALLKANEDLKGASADKVKKEIAKLGAKFGYDISMEDFEQSEGEIQEDDMQKVAGGISSGCFLSNAGCFLIGEISSSGGCIALGLY